MTNVLEDIRRSTGRVVEGGVTGRRSPGGGDTPSPLHVRIDPQAIAAEVARHPHLYSEEALAELAPTWEQDYHFLDAEDAEATATAVLVLDALNFCFWPLEGYQYVDLARGLKKAFLEDKSRLTAESLSRVTEGTLQGWIQRSDADKIPLMSERVRLVNEIGANLIERFSGRTTNLVSACSYSASKLVSLVTSTFPGFRDHAIYEGSQVFFYKRAQIFVGDLWGAFKGEGLGRFDDIDQVTCFADYRVPQILHSLKILQYSPELQELLNSKKAIPAGSDMEVQIRSATIQAVDAMVQQINSSKSPKHKLIPIKLDWILWGRAELVLDQLPPFHRTLTIYY